MKLATKRLIIRDLEARDAKEIVRSINNLDVSRWLLVVPHPYGLKDAKEFIGKQRKKIKEKPRLDYTFAIERKSEKGVIGVIGLHKVDKFQGTAGMGYWLGADYHRNGYMYEAASAVLKFAFRKLKLRRINIEAFAGNEASNGLIKKLGFVYEGRCRQKLRSKSDGKIHDEIVYGMLKSDFLKSRKR